MNDIITDGSLSFAGGVNSLKPTTVASTQHPDGLYRNQAAWLNNATVRGGGITPRGGLQYLVTMPESGLYQGGFMYEPRGGLPYLVLSISGKLYRVRVDTTNAVQQLSDATTINPVTPDFYHFVQAEEFLVIQPGDNSTAPLIWDGVTLRRSNGADLIFKGYIDQDSITIPAVGSTMTVNMSIPYVGLVGDTVLLKFEGKFLVTAIGPGNSLTLETVQSSFVGQTIFRGVADAFQLFLYVAPEIPAAGPMDYYMGRIFYAKGRTVSGGDIVRGPTGHLIYNFTDSVLNVTENPLSLGGDGFTVPAEAGDITALAHTGEMDTTLGQGQLYIFTRRSIYRLAVPVSREQWIAADDATQPLQTVVQLRYGSVGDRCVVQVNEDLFYQTMETAIRSLRLAQKQSGQWGNTPISRNEDRVLRFNDKVLMKFSSGALHDNRLLMTALPMHTPVGVAHQALIPLDFDLISTLEEKRPPAFEGVWEGVPWLQIFSADFNGQQRCFGVARGEGTDNPIQIWELTDNLKFDQNPDGEKRITWVVETPAYTWNQEFLLKKLIGGDLWVDRVYGTVVFKVEYRPDGDTCWHFWHQWEICSARTSCEDLENPVCYPIIPYGEGFRQTMSLPLPQQDCQETSQRQMNWGYQFQVRITVIGFCRLRGLMLYATPVERKQYHNLICPGEVGETQGASNVGSDIQYVFSSPADPFLGPPYPPTGYQLNTITRTAGQTLLTWTVPDVIVDVLMVYKFTPFITFNITVENYEYPSWSGFASYIPNQRVTYNGVRYVSLTNNSNKPPASFPSDWTIDPTIFELYWNNGISYVKIGDSNTEVSAPVTWSWLTMTFQAYLQSQGTTPWAFFVVANAGISTLAQSNVFGFTDTCPLPAPTGLFVFVAGPGIIDVQWNYDTPPSQDFILAFGQTSGGPYDYSQSVISRFDNGALGMAGFDPGTYYVIVCARNSNTCVSPPASEVSFVI